MPWVMMPVPEEHEKEFNKELMTIVMESRMLLWDDGAIGELLGTLTSKEVGLVQLVALDVVQGSLTPLATAADALGVTEREILALKDAVNNICDDQDRPKLMLYDDRAADGSAPDGDRGVLAILGSVARSVMRLAADTTE